MTTFQRGLIEKKIQEMEEGAFQELMLRFLPLYDSNYIGIHRHGGTEFGKTCIGVPDLLKTFNDGRQVACECGTQKDYWKKPLDSKNMSNWKPIEDAEKCLSELENPIEIILASSRPFPKKDPNVKNIIINYFSKKNMQDNYIILHSNS